MKISDRINQLEAIRAQFGDLDCYKHYFYGDQLLPAPTPEIAFLRAGGTEEHQHLWKERYGHEARGAMIVLT
jgi:hypothetical protein